MSVPEKSDCAYGRELPFYEFDNSKFEDLRLETRVYVLQVYDTIQYLNPGGQRGLEYEWLLMAMSCLGASELESKMLMARKIFYSWTSRHIFDKSSGFSWSTEPAKIRKWYWEDFMAIATR
ncbi:hypothetical protein ISF_09811 [Cordyceps fumosorosea ARSEF 2679]|uniref:Uncharacterized protein n=2 Tax=Cordyceps fumosorosea (strain ARSEF 2679) TaxID=1081104 RepID=A0A167BY76_CORFA|nr:hypothetical protein ISF_09811 [Cordyceps fumosorosea ARSEF 2679]OAA40560.1 hypothetical protein ISF_09811 [Cordyceps fumosorosea ARSEF 2679]